MRAVAVWHQCARADDQSFGRRNGARPDGRLPVAASAAQMLALHGALTHGRRPSASRRTQRRSYRVQDRARRVEVAASRGSPRIPRALLGAEDLPPPVRTPADAVELTSASALRTEAGRGHRPIDGPHTSAT